MSDVTGTVHHQFNGREHQLRLTLGGIAKLQGVHGTDLGGFLSARSADSSELPAFAILLDIVKVALEKGGADPSISADLADDMLTADIHLAKRVLQAAFPSAGVAPGGKARAPRK